MGFDHRIKKESTENTTANDNAVNVQVMHDGDFEEACVLSEVKPGLSDLENIIMEGDIILKVHADGEIQETAEKGNWTGLPNNGTGEYCTKHHEMFHLRDERLIKPGDMFNSHREFVQYISENAKRWCFYYKCTESYNVDTDNETYVYNCVYLKNKDYKKKSLKKRYNSKTDCPCKIKLKRKPNEGLTVVYVCNHHDHELSAENFNKLVNTKKLPPYIKEMIMDLLSLEVDISKIRKFVEMETGIKMSRAFYYDVERKMKINNDERQISDKRLKELSDKMTLVDEMYSCDDEENTDDQGLKKKRLRPTKGVEGKKRKKNSYTETDQSMDNSQETEQRSGNRRDLSITWDISSIGNIKNESTLNADDSNDYQDTCENTYTDDYNTNDYTTSESIQDTTENVKREGAQEEQYQYQTVVLQDEFGNIINCDDNQQIMIIEQNEMGQIAGEGETIGYFDGEKIIYMEGSNNESHEEAVQNDNENENDTENSPCDVGVQTSSQKPGHSYVPVFDVYMKDGNVTGFVVNDKAMKQKGGVEKGVQTPEDSVENVEEIEQEQQVEQEEEKEVVNVVRASNTTQEIISGDTYTKHEYVHRYNIDHYMTKPNFPKYIDTLAKKTRIDVLHMLTRVYNEKAMFKMTTTQTGKEGNTKIWYLTDVRRKGQYKMSDEEKRKRDKIGQYLTDILILKERVKCLKKENEELVTRNKYLEEVALRLANMRN